MTKDKAVRVGRRLGYFAAGLALAGLFAPAAAHLWATQSETLKAVLGQQPAQAQTQAHPFSGQAIVYFSHDGRWQEAFIRQVSGRFSQGRTVWLYSVELLEAGGQVVANVPPERLRTIAQAQAQGLTQNVYDLSSQAGIDQMLAAHNAPRRAVGVADLRWSPALATSAQRWAETLLRENRFEHSSRRDRNNAGENLATTTSSTSGGAYSTPTRAISGWIDERADYDAAANLCRSGRVCGHYTQVVWRTTTDVGCGLARTADSRREVWVCHYSPAGNVVGQRPY